MGELYVQIEEYHRFPQLAPLLEGEADLCQLNALAQKLSELDDWQSISFEGLVNMEVEKREPFGIPRLIDLAYSADCCYVAVDVEDDAALGKFYAENGFVPKVENLSDEVFELLDFQKIGRDCRTGEGGVFTSGGYVVQHTELAEAYKDMDLTLKTPDYTILLEISKGHFDDPAYDSEKTIRLPLPAEPAAMDAALDAIGAWDWREVGFHCLDCRAPSLISHIEGDDNIQIALRELEVEHISECTILDVRCTLPRITGFTEYSDLADLIYDGQNLGILLDERGQGQPHFMEHFLAALELEDCYSLKGALDIANNLHCYDFVLTSELADYGKTALRQTEGTILNDCIDYEGYAEQLLEQQDFRCALDGEAYIKRNAQALVSDYVQPSPEMTM